MNYDAIKDFIEQLQSATPEMAMVACLIALGYAFKFVPKLPNKFIPPILLVLAVIAYPMVADNGKAPYTMRYPIVRQAMTGVVIWFVAWAVHGLVLKRWVDKFLPKTSNGDTKFFTDKKSEPPTTQPP